MKEIVLNNSKTNTTTTLNLPTSLDDIDVTYLNEIADTIKVAPNYSLIGIVYHAKLALVLTASKKTKEQEVLAIPIFIKAGNNTSDFINNISIKDVIIISGSDIAMGHHVNSPVNDITIPKVCAVFHNNSTFGDLITNPEEIYFLELKIVPNSAIKGVNAILSTGEHKHIVQQSNND